MPVFFFCLIPAPKPKNKDKKQTNKKPTRILIILDFKTVYLWRKEETNAAAPRKPDGGSYSCCFCTGWTGVCFAPPDAK